MHQILTRQPIALLPNAEIYDAIEILNAHNISCVPIVDKENKPVGIISWRDILKAIEAGRKKRNNRGDNKVGEESPSYKG